MVLLVRYICERMSEQDVLGIQADEPGPQRVDHRPQPQARGLGWVLTDYNDVRHLSAQGIKITEHQGEVDDRRR